MSGTRAHFLRPYLERPGTSWVLRDASTDAPVATRLIPAFDRKARNAGLLGRESLPADTAIVLAPCSGVHTWFMRFPIDVLFVDRGGCVLALRRSLAPWRLALRPGAFAVLELPAGSAARIEVGHELRLESVSTGVGHGR